MSEIKKEKYSLDDCVILCKEYSKDLNDMAVYALEIEEITGQLIRNLRLRHKFNPELNYYITKKINKLECIQFLKANSKIPVEEGVLIEL